MAVATKRRRTVRKDPPVTGGTTYHVLDQEGHDLLGPQSHPPIALVKAQDWIQRKGVDGDEGTLYIERRTLFGDPVELYRVVRYEDGSIQTFIMNRED